MGQDMRVAWGAVAPPHPRQSAPANTYKKIVNNYCNIHMDLILSMYKVYEYTAKIDFKYLIFIKDSVAFTLFFI